jgi:CheY-like chemotaxis protein
LGQQQPRFGAEGGSLADPPQFDGRRVLVVEDDAMIAMLIEDMLADLGCTVIGPAHDLADALDLAGAAAALDVAVLDVNLAGKPVFAVADALREKGVPTIFATGYGDLALRDTDRGSPVLQKPYNTNGLARALSQALDGR